MCAHRVAREKDHSIQARPLASAVIDQSPGFGEALARLHNGIIRNGNVEWHAGSHAVARASLAGRRLRLGAAGNSGDSRWHCRFCRSGFQGHRRGLESYQGLQEILRHLRYNGLNNPFGIGCIDSVSYTWAAAAH